jgi:hypothetical protein
MKIVHVSNFTMRRNGARFYGTEYKLNNGFTRLGHNVLSFCDRDIASRYFLGLREAGRGHANRKLLDVCQTVRPDLLLLGHASLISPATLQTIRSNIPDIRIGHWNCDSLSFAPRNMALLKSLASVVDATFVTTAGDALRPIIASGGRVTYMPNPVDASIETERAFDAANPEFDLVFAGSADAERVALCERIRSGIPELKFEVRGMLGRSPVQGADLIDLLGRSRMGLALSRPNDALLYASDRMAQLMGNGVLAFVDERAGFQTIFTDRELITFTDSGDLIAKLRHFKADDAERRDIARAGWIKVHANFSATLVAKWIIETTFRLPATENYAWPSAVYEH